MKKIIFLTILLFAIVGYGLFYWGPEKLSSKVVFNPSYFDSNEKMGRIVARRFFQDIKKVRIIVLGTDSRLKASRDIWYEFLKVAIADGLQVADFYSLGPVARPLVSRERPLNSLDEIAESGVVVVHTPSDLDLYHKIKLKFGDQVIFFFQSPFSVFPSDLVNMGLSCAEKTKDTLDCWALRASTRVYRHPLEDRRLMAMMEQPVDALQLLMVGAYDVH